MNRVLDKRGGQKGTDCQANAKHNYPALNRSWPKPKHDQTDHDLHHSRNQKEYNGSDGDGPMVGREAPCIYQVPGGIVHKGLSDVCAGVQKRDGTKDQEKDSTVRFAHVVSSIRTKT